MIHRAILISGSALSPWAIQSDPLSVKKKVASDTGCHGDLLEDDLAPCLRRKSISELLAIKLDSPRWETDNFTFVGYLLSLPITFILCFCFKTYEFELHNQLIYFTFNLKKCINNNKYTIAILFSSHLWNWIMFY